MSDTDKPMANLLTRREARRALEALAAGTRAGWPPLPDETLTGESIYAKNLDDGHCETINGRVRGRK